MQIKAHPDLFKLKDNRVSALTSGMLSAQALSHMITVGDCMILIGDTIYPLTESEFFAAQRFVPKTSLDKAMFLSILADPLDCLSALDQLSVTYIREHKNNCSVCKFKAFKARLQAIVEKYPELVLKFNIKKYPTILKAVYPGCSLPFLSIVSKKIVPFFEKRTYTREPCFLCVQKHLGMAYVKGMLAIQGYPEHFVLALANLLLAFEECPSECTELRDVIMLCIAKSKYDMLIFLPLGTVLYMLTMLMESDNLPARAFKLNLPAKDMALLLNDEMKGAIVSIPLVQRAQIITKLAKLHDILLKLNIDTDKLLKVQWQGLMGDIADSFAIFSKPLANMIRNRRLLFKAAPSMSRNTEYDCSDLLLWLKAK